MSSGMRSMGRRLSSREAPPAPKGEERSRESGVESQENEAKSK